MTMIRAGIVLAATAAAFAIFAPAADAADAPYRTRERVYERPVPRVYYQPVRPTAVCRVAFAPDAKGWPKEQNRVARCTHFD
ncbi:hypothetical protein IHQ68_12610 [Chelatococcus sambhunathii]|uniref:Lectin-like protein BA14k n=1 Tax=Chelatococcus sambhunathii TaxID=363953 RepID=A0ABU1DHI5_9HYPH|nr:hypothetical protein [Chelatococcus sambhunathii]MDR4307459.1 hypothetical protein [Chelatococcus sambhunathii]